MPHRPSRVTQLDRRDDGLVTLAHWILLRLLVTWFKAVFVFLISAKDEANVERIGDLVLA